MNYPKLAFTDVVKTLQEKLGSRTTYKRVEKMTYVDGLTPIEIQFLGQLDSFYMASFGENGYPYIQHRGGPKGFVKVIDDQTIGLIDFTGNKQYISLGNISVNPKVSLIFVSYPMRARLKMYAEAEIVEIDDRPELFDFLKPEDYKFRPERILLFHIKAYDWNCPQHITPKYSLLEIDEITAPKDRQIEELKQEVERLKQQLAEIKPIT